MRIKSVTVRNYRVHRDLTVQLDDSRTLLGGPNECGKSTLVEAVHRALFLKSKVTGDVQKSMVSTWFAGSPEVEIGFAAGNSDYVLAKRFSGNTGTTRLVQVGGETWHGDDAETRLASLLKVGAVGGGRGVGERVAQQWSHLWVWQGQSGSDPSEHANLQKDGLLQRLQQTGGAAALQSEMDARVAARFAAAKEESSAVSTFSRYWARPRRIASARPNGLKSCAKLVEISRKPRRPSLAPQTTYRS